MEGINILMTLGFVFMTGVTAVPLLASVLMIEGGANIVINAFLLTSIIIGAMSLFAIRTPKDFTSYTKPMFIAIITIIIFSLINLFIFKNPIFATMISAIVVLLFSFMVLLDTQNIIKGNYSNPIEGAIALYLDFINIFMSLLQIMSFFNSVED
jgi:modulator of FtsH protease